MNKLILFRQFYVMVVAYIYFTRIIVYLLKSTAAYNLTWLAERRRRVGHPRVLLRHRLDVPPHRGQPVPAPERGRAGTGGYRGHRGGGAVERRDAARAERATTVPTAARVPRRRPRGTARGNRRQGESDGFRDLDVQRMTRFSTRTFRAIRLAPQRDRRYSPRRQTASAVPTVLDVVPRLCSRPAPLDEFRALARDRGRSVELAMLLSSLMRFSM